MAQPEPGTLLAFLTEVPDPGDRAGLQHPLVAMLAHACAVLVYGLVAEGVLSIADRWLPGRSAARPPAGGRASEVAERPPHVTPSGERLLAVPDALGHFRYGGRALRDLVLDLDVGRKRPLL